MNTNPQYLYELLREKRNKLAKESDVEPYMILQNKVLLEIAGKRPRTIEELGKIKGMGEKKLARYGSIILEAVNGSLENSVFTRQEEKIFSVSEYIDFLNRILITQKVIVIGEVSSLSSRSNYTFFSLHDKNGDAILNCFVWQNKLESLGVELKEGLELKVAGFPRIYEKTGKFTFEVEYIGLVGEGALKLAFEKLKKKLEAEGYFDIERKKKIPDYVQRIGLITSSYGDAIKDFTTHLGRFGFKIYFYDIRVEGFYAIDDIISAIHWFNENMLDIDVLVLTRGGGSLERLQPFNSEPVARAIFGSRIPIVTGIGHEDDTTIADLVADVRASTPTDAARVLSDLWRNVSDLLSNIQTNMVSILSLSMKNFNNRLVNNEKNIMMTINRILKARIQKLNDLQRILGSQFEGLIYQVKQVQIKFSNNWEKLKNCFRSVKNEVLAQEHTLIYESARWLTGINDNLVNLEQKIYLGNPEVRLKQGYSIIMSIDRKIVKSSKQIKIGDMLNLKFYQGSASSKVEKIDE